VHDLGFCQPFCVRTMFYSGVKISYVPEIIR